MATLKGSDINWESGEARSRRGPSARPDKRPHLVEELLLRVREQQLVLPVAAPRPSGVAFSCSHKRLANQKVEAAPPTRLVGFVGLC